MKIQENGEDLIVSFISSNQEVTTIINIQDKWIINDFPIWIYGGTRSKYVYCTRGIKTEYSTVYERVLLHRLIVYGKGNAHLKNEQVDHKDRNRLNNRRSNLRICSMSQNMANVGPRFKGKYKGVHDEKKYRNLSKPFGSYISYIDAKSRGLRKREYLGRYKTAEEAALAYDKRAKEIWGEFAYLNFPEE